MLAGDERAHARARAHTHTHTHRQHACTHAHTHTHYKNTGNMSDKELRRKCRGEHFVFDHYHYETASVDSPKHCPASPEASSSTDASADSSALLPSLKALHRVVSPPADVVQEEGEGEKPGVKEEDDDEQLHRHLQIEISGKIGLGRGMPGAVTRGSFPLNVGERHI